MFVELAGHGGPRTCAADSSPGGRRNATGVYLRHIKLGLQKKTTIAGPAGRHIAIAVNSTV
jgi:hypothetical protein